MVDFSKDRAELKAVFAEIYTPPLGYTPRKQPYLVWTNHGQLHEHPDLQLAALKREWMADLYLKTVKGILWQYKDDNLRQARELATVVAEENGYDLVKEIDEIYLHISTVITSNETRSESGLIMLTPKEKPIEPTEITTLTLNDIAIINAAREKELRAAGLIGGEQNHFLENRVDNRPTANPINKQISAVAKIVTGIGQFVRGIFKFILHEKVLMIAFFLFSAIIAFTISYIQYPNQTVAFFIKVSHWLHQKILSN